MVKEMEMVTDNNKQTFNKIYKSSLALSIAFVIVACGSSNDNNAESSDIPSNVQTAIDSPISTLSQKLANTLAYMGNEERLAYDVYNKLFDIWGTKQFTNIANNSEIKHIQAVQELVKKYKLDDINFTNVDMPELAYKDTAIKDMQAGVYDISKIQKLYDDLIVAGSISEVEALKVGCTVEVVDVTDLDEYILLAKEAKASDIVDTFTSLRSGSYNHYWSFDNGLKNQGFDNGCCTWDELCHPEYAQDNNKDAAEDSNTTGNMNNKHNKKNDDSNV
jgi:hypothetical protein